MQQPSRHPRIIAVIVFLGSLVILWTVGYHALWNRLTTEVIGKVIDSKDIPSTGAPGYVTLYTYRDNDDQIQEYIATAAPSSLDRSLPVDTIIHKEKWNLGYFKNDERVRFSTTFYTFFLVVGLCGLFWSVFTFLPKRKKYRE